MMDGDIKRLIGQLRQRSRTVSPSIFGRARSAPDLDCRAAANMLEQYLDTKQEYRDFQQEVSDVVKAFNNGWANCRAVRQQDWEALLGFIIPAPTPDPLVEVLGDLEWNNNSPECAAELRAALEARGLEIKEKE